MALLGWKPRMGISVRTGLRSVNMNHVGRYYKVKKLPEACLNLEPRIED